MRIYDDNGNMVNTEVSDFGRDLSVSISDFFERLFRIGMTPLEARGLIGYLQSQLEFSAIMDLMHHQMTQEIKRRNDDSSGSDNGAATAQSK